MDRRTIRLLVENSAVRKVSIVADGSAFRVEVYSPTGTHIATTLKGKMRTWSSIDSAAKYVQSLGVGKAELILQEWQPNQKSLQI